MKIAIRVDASERIGSGHVMRCLALADELSKNGFECVFISQCGHGNLNHLILERGFRVKTLNFYSDISQNSALAYPTYSDATVESDYVQTQFYLTKDPVDLVIVDHYSLDYRWESKIRSLTKGIIAIDDIANRQHDCDILIDQNYDDVQRYVPFVPENCTLLLGSKYALLRPEYAENKTQRVFLSDYDKIENIFVFFGGADMHDLTGKTLEALSHKSLKKISLDIVVGGSYLYIDNLEYNANIRGNTHIHKPQLHLADLMIKADLAVGAGGVTSWERLTLGLPSLIITQADNQRPISEILDHKGVVKLIGSAEDTSSDLILSFLVNRALITNLLKKSQSGMELCDGMGIPRVVDAIKSFLTSLNHE